MKRPFICNPNNPDWRRIAATMYDYVCDEVEAGRELVIMVADPVRSAEQNNRMWALLSDIAKQVEWAVDGRMQHLSAEDWKHILSASLKHQQRVAQGTDGGFVILGQQTSKMSKQELNDLMTVIEAFGAERGVLWSAPERWGP